MNIKNMKGILLAVLVLALGLVCRAEAFYATVRSTAVQISSAAAYPNGMELLSISHSTGSSFLGDQFIVTLDTWALEANFSGLGQTLPGGTTLQSVTYNTAKYPVQQNIVPPIVVLSTNNATGSARPLTRYDFRDENGCGIPVGTGLVILQPGTAYGTVVTVEWRPTPVIGPCRQQ